MGKVIVSCGVTDRKSCVGNSRNPQCKRIRICKFCFNQFTSRFKKPVFCSITCACRHRAKARQEKSLVRRTVECAACSKVFTRSRGGSLYCSKACRPTKHGNGNCQWCGDVFRKKYYSAKYCSLKCRDSAKKAEVVCLFCGTAFKVHVSLKNRGGMAGRFCSQDCCCKYRVAEKNPNWRGGGSYTRGESWLFIAREVRIRDGHKCRHCGKPETNRKHDVHHIVPYRITKDNSLENLITLCLKCHRKETAIEIKIYGKPVAS